MADDVSLVVNGRRYGGWKSLRITLSIESLAGSFTLDVSDRWDGQTDPWPIAEEDVCRVDIGDDTVISGFIDKRSLSASATSRTLSYSGRDRAAVLVDCSATVQGASVKVGKSGSDIDPTKNHGQSVKWTYTNINVAEFTRAIAAPFGLTVSVQSGLVLPRVSKMVVNPGETGFEAVKRVAEADGVLVVSDGSGDILITRSGTGRASALVEGFNLLEGSVEYDGTNRFRRYLISTQIPGTDEASGEATQVQAQAFDLDVKRPNRVLLIRPDKGYNAAEAKQRADWEARIRAARAETVTVRVQGWRQPGGALWPINALVLVSAPRMLGVFGDMLISQVEYSLGDGGQVTTLHLVRPDAFTPEPQVAVTSGEGAWKELAKGAD